jgi:hypothetical protein
MEREMSNSGSHLAIDSLKEMQITNPDPLETCLPSHALGFHWKAEVNPILTGSIPRLYTRRRAPSTDPSL